AVLYVDGNAGYVSCARVGTRREAEELGWECRVQHGAVVCGRLAATGEEFCRKARAPESARQSSLLQQNRRQYKWLSFFEENGQSCRARSRSPHRDYRGWNDLRAVVPLSRQQGICPA